MDTIHKTTPVYAPLYTPIHPYTPLEHRINRHYRWDVCKGTVIYTPILQEGYDTTPVAVVVAIKTL